MASNAIPSTQLDLWAIAYAKLPEKYKNVIIISSTVRAEDALKAVQERRKDVDSALGRWHVRMGNKTFKLRDTFAKTAKWIEKFVEVGDVAVQYDPGHTALPWAAIRFLLKVAVNDLEKYEVVCEGVENISNTLTQCLLIEVLQSNSNSGLKAQLDKHLTNLYVAILMYLAKAKRYYDEEGAEKWIKSITNFKTKYERLLDDIRAKQAEVERLLVFLNSEKTIDIEQVLQVLTMRTKHLQSSLEDALQELRGPVLRVEQHVQIIHDNYEAEEKLRILTWISTQPHSEHHRGVVEKVLKGTGTWLLKDSQFLQWQRSSTSSILWLHGIPGSGKRCLTSIVVDLFLKEFSNGRSSCPCYFYCKSDSAEKGRSQASTIVASIVRQMSCLTDDGEVLQPVRDLYDKRFKQGFTNVPPSLSESVEMVVALAEKKAVTMIFLDALDECDDESRQDLLDAIQSIITTSAGLVKIFVSSRDDRDIVLHLTDCSNVQIAAIQNEQDIGRFVDEQVARRINKRQLLAGEPPAALVESIKHELKTGADGMFRWVELQLQYICSLTTPGFIQKRLGKLPRGLQKIYQEIYDTNMNNREQEERIIAEYVFRWLLCAQETWQPQDLISALEWTIKGYEITLDAVLRLTFNMVVHDTVLDILRFAHLSVREFLEGALYLPEQSHAFALEKCLSCFFPFGNEISHVQLSDDVSTTDYETDSESGSSISSNEITTHKNTKDNPVVNEALSGGVLTEQSEVIGIANNDFRNFKRYATYTWAIHAKLAKKCMQQGNVAALFETFIRLPCSVQFKAWHRFAMKRRWNYSGSNISEICERLESSLCDPPHPIFALCAWGLDELCDSMINDMQEDARNKRNRLHETMLYVACKYDQLAVVQRLLMKQFHFVSSQRNASYRNPLVVASLKGHVEIVKLLLTSCVDVYYDSEQWSAALEASARYGDNEILKILLNHGSDHGVNVNSIGWYHGTPIQQAAAGGDIQTVKLLLERGADANIQCGAYNTPLQAAAYHGHRDVVELLILQGIDARGHSENYSKALAAALVRGHDDIVQVLNGRSKEIRPHASMYGSAICAASFHGRSKAVVRVLELGATVDGRHPFWGSTLIAACNGKETGIIKLLLRHGANVNIVDIKGRTALKIATERGYTEIARLLIDAGAVVEAETGLKNRPQRWIGGWAVLCLGGLILVWVETRIRGWIRG